MSSVLTPEVLRFVDSSVLCWLASIDPDGMPNVSPKEIFCAHGESKLLIANIASPESERNLRGNPNACVSFVDVFVQKDYKLKGSVAVVDQSQPGYRELEQPLVAMTKGLFKMRSTFFVSCNQGVPHRGAKLPIQSSCH